MNYSMSSENEYSYPSIYTFPYFLICKDMSIIVPYVFKHHNNVICKRHVDNPQCKIIPLRIIKNHDYLLYSLTLTKTDT